MVRLWSWSHKLTRAHSRLWNIIVHESIIVPSIYTIRESNHNKSFLGNYLSFHMFASEFVREFTLFFMSDRMFILFIFLFYFVTIGPRCYSNSVFMIMSIRPCTILGNDSWKTHTDAQEAVRLTVLLNLQLESMADLRIALWHAGTMPYTISIT